MKQANGHVMPRLAEPVVPTRFKMDHHLADDLQRDVAEQRYLHVSARNVARLKGQYTTQLRMAFLLRSAKRRGWPALK